MQPEVQEERLPMAREQSKQFNGLFKQTKHDTTGTSQNGRRSS